MDSIYEQIETILTLKQSAQNRDSIIEYIDNDPIKFKQLMSFFFSDNLRENQRSAWPILHICLKNPSLLKPYHKAMLDNLNKPKHDAVIRNTVRIYQEIKIPEEIEGQLFEKCFAYLSNPKRALAIRAFSMTVCRRIALKESFLVEELLGQLQYIESEGWVSPGFNHRLSKEINILSQHLDSSFD